ncbi:acyl-CoA N-acyltransferase [Lasiosphaeris hirsuta]|uniref:Acyl-CoA N-acyltransferase n=1 Tax=Lasiosphaeris hirsuta TaxID=260670 RepID=A0AA40B1T8_9PEZI|nr:acyl-CoA N-acyltransferase [Lasiosphaeris hirsuta]
MTQSPGTAGVDDVSLRLGTVDDVSAVLRLMDIATQWLVQQGCDGQWGTGTHSDRPDRIKQATEFAESGGLWVAVTNDSQKAVIGAVCVGDAFPYVTPATEPELYIKLLLTDRSYKGRGLGALLLEKARALAREAGVAVMRVDCYRGPDERLVRYYESQGFQRVEAFMVKGEWPAQLLMQRLDVDE